MNNDETLMKAEFVLHTDKAVSSLLQTLRGGKSAVFELEDKWSCVAAPYHDAVLVFAKDKQTDEPSALSVVYSRSEDRMYSLCDISGFYDWHELSAKVTKEINTIYADMLRNRAFKTNYLYPFRGDDVTARVREKSFGYDRKLFDGYIPDGDLIDIFAGAVEKEEWIRSYDPYYCGKLDKEQACEIMAQERMKLGDDALAENERRLAGVVAAAKDGYGFFVTVGDVLDIILSVSELREIIANGKLFKENASSSTWERMLTVFPHRRMFDKQYIAVDFEDITRIYDNGLTLYERGDNQNGAHND